jgi:hypothetical protein
MRYLLVDVAQPARQDRRDRLGVARSKVRARQHEFAKIGATQQLRRSAHVGFNFGYRVEL